MTSRLTPAHTSPVIPAEAGIQGFESRRAAAVEVLEALGPRLRRDDAREERA